MTSRDENRSAPNPLDVAPGPRYTGNDRILKIEDELRDEGVEIPNPARPLAASNATADELRAEIDDEAASESPDRQRIAALNRQLKALQTDE